MIDQTSITIRRPDDMHVHLRDGAFLRDYVLHTADHFARAIVMPNLRPPITTCLQAAEYKARILGCTPKGVDFTPLMTLYLTDRTSQNEIRKAQDVGFIHGVKLYPAGATTNSADGVTDLKKVYPLLEVMQEIDLPLLVHGEVTGDDVDIFDREDLFLADLRELIKAFPRLRIVLEHITTRNAAHFVRDAAPDVRIAATITAHHLLENRNAIFRGGINPHNYCLPILKREADRLALLTVATSGSPRFFAGTDSAPHVRHTKERTCGCAGCFTAPYALGLYATAFDSAGLISRLEAFTSEFGAAFYGLPLNAGKIILVKQAETIPETVPVAFTTSGDPAADLLLRERAGTVVPFWAGKTLPWSVIR